jgi:hypothetical protein
VWRDEGTASWDKDAAFDEENEDGEDGDRLCELWRDNYVLHRAEFS